MKASRARHVVLLLFAVLAISVIAWQWPNLRTGSFWPLLFLVPLCAPLPGILRARRYTYAWASFVVIAYVALGVTEVMAAPRARLFPALILFTAFALFVALVLFLRLPAKRCRVSPASRTGCAGRVAGA
jgi:uncharacterized membrane protein